MTNAVYVAQLVCESKDGDGRWKIIVGVFSTEELANESIENFVEGVLNMEYPDIIVASQSVDKFLVDQAINEELPTSFPVDIPF